MEAQIKTTDNVVSKQTVHGLLGSSTPIGLPGFALVIILKIVIMILFSSGYMNQLFIPFVSHFLTHFDNTWDYFFRTTIQRDQFPYQPMMLYIMAIFCLPLKALGWNNIFLVNFFMKLPTLLSDILIAYLLIKMFPTRISKVFWYYFLSPIILYACYFHGQLDLIATAILFSAVFCLHRHQVTAAAILTGLALSTKTHVAAAVPLFLFYIYRNEKPLQIYLFVSYTLLTMLLLVFPYIDSPGFSALVLHNPKQNLIFESHIDIGNMQIYLPIFAVLIAYGRFALYPKINADLLDAFVTLSFALFVLLIVPAPGWYVWIAPFLSLFMIKYSARDYRIVPCCFTLYGFYLLYFLFFHQFDYSDLIFCNVPLNFKISGGHLASLAFTLLEVALLATIVICYRTGVRSNANYRRDKAIVIGIGGDSGAGKSTLLHDIKMLLHGKVAELEGDADHKWARSDEHWKGYTHLDPKANFLHRQADAIFNLKRGRSVQRVDYDHDKGSFTDQRMIAPNDFIVLSGLHTFYLPKSRKVIDLKIFMDPDQSVKTHWKTTRDQKERGYSEGQVAAQMNRRKTDVDKFIAPQKDFADICVRYYPAQTVEGCIDAETKLYLDLSLSSSIHLDDLVQELMKTGLLLHWDYSTDLSKQDLTLSEPIQKELLEKFASDMIPNLDELVDVNIDWQEGFRGFVQLIILLVLNDLMKEKEDFNEN